MHLRPHAFLKFFDRHAIVPAGEALMIALSACQDQRERERALELEILSGAFDMHIVQFRVLRENMARNKERHGKTESTFKLAAYHLRNARALLLTCLERLCSV